MLKFLLHFFFYCFFCSSFLNLGSGITSVNMRVPAKTRTAPIQWSVVNGLLKYTIDKIRLTNFLRVTTRVTVSALHSAVRMNTERIQIYLRAVLRRNVVTIGLKPPTTSLASTKCKKKKTLHPLKLVKNNFLYIKQAQININCGQYSKWFWGHNKLTVLIHHKFVLFSFTLYRT